MIEQIDDLKQKLEELQKQVNSIEIEGIKSFYEQKKGYLQMDKNNETIIAYKGFEHDFKCRDFQYEVGKTYETKENIECCKIGFHACKVPLDVFNYYSPADDHGNLRHYAVVEQSGEIKKDEDKTASSKIKIKAELSIMDLVKCHVDFLKENHPENVEDNTGNYSAATNTGYSSAATNTGDYSAATNTGNSSVATNTGNWSAATNTGDWSKASVTNENSAAFAFGFESKAMSKKGWIIIVDWRIDNHERYINQIYTAKVGQKIKNKKIKPNHWYWFENGKLKEEEAERD